MKKINKILSTLTIRQKIMIITLIFMIAVIGIGTVLTYLNMNTARRELSTSFMASLDIFSERYSDTLESYQSIAKSLASDNNLIALNQSPSAADISIMWDYAELLRKLRFFSLNSELRNNITVYLPQKERAFSSQDGIFNFEPNNGIGDLISRKSGIWQVIHDKQTNQDMLSIMYVSVGLSDIGRVFITADININDTKNLLNNFKGAEHGMALLLTPDSQVIFHSNIYGLDLDGVAEILGSQEKDEGDFTFVFNQEPYHLQYIQSEENGFTYGFLLPDSHFTKPVRRLLLWMFIFIFLAVVFTLLFSRGIHGSIITPIYHMMEAMKTVNPNGSQVRLDVRKGNEISFLFEQFNNMAERIENYINEITETQNNLDRTKINLLQSQINPHFLYNSLNFVYRMISSEKLEAASTMALYLGKYFRYATNVNAETTRIKDEVENINTYINIQQFRYPRFIDFFIDMDVELEDVLIPRMLIQPLIENIFSHGVSSFENPVNIRLRFRLIDNFINISVEDNGAGMTGERLANVRDSLNKMPRDASFALSNIYMRLQLLYKSEAQMSINSKEGNGTSVLLTIPLSLPENRRGKREGEGPDNV